MACSCLRPYGLTCIEGDWKHGNVEVLEPSFRFDAGVDQSRDGVSCLPSAFSDKAGGFHYLHGIAGCIDSERGEKSRNELCPSGRSLGRDRAEWPGGHYLARDGE